MALEKKTVFSIQQLSRIELTIFVKVTFNAKSKRICFPFSAKGVFRMDYETPEVRPLF